MNKDFLDYFNRELEYFRRSSVSFAEQHRKIAGRLKELEVGEDKDPHVSRLVESFAFLNARLRLKLDDEFPELCQALLNVLYPEYLNPIPSCGVVAFSCKQPHLVAAGSELYTPPIDGEPCRFRTSYPVELWPIRIAAAGVDVPPFVSPPTRFAEDCKGVLRIDLQTLSEDQTFDKFPLHRLRFHLNGEAKHIFDLYEMLFTSVRGIALAESETDKDPWLLSEEAISPVGFRRHESLLDYSARSRMGFHLLREFFVFPEKFCFFDLEIQQERFLQKFGQSDSLKLFIYFDAMAPRLREFLSYSEFVEERAANQFLVLGATPIVNLFEKTAEPINLTTTSTEYRVVPDTRRPLAYEVFSVDRVSVHSESEFFEVSPFYSADHQAQHEDSPVYWFMNRRDASLAANRPGNFGTDVYLSLVGIDGKPLKESELRTVEVVTTCLNRDYPSRLLSNPNFFLSGKDSVVQVQSLMRPRETARPDVKDLHWRLISHLILNHLSLTNDSKGVATLREILRLYNFNSRKSVNQMINGIVRTESKRIVGRIDSGIPGGFCRGTGITIHLDPHKFSGGGEYLFAAILDRFLAMYTTINSFTQTSVELSIAGEEKKVFSWPPRSGEGELI